MSIIIKLTSESGVQLRFYSRKDYEVKIVSCLESENGNLKIFFYVHQISTVTVLRIIKLDNDNVNIIGI